MEEKTTFQKLEKIAETLVTRRMRNGVVFPPKAGRSDLWAIVEGNNKAGHDVVTVDYESA